MSESPKEYKAQKSKRSGSKIPSDSPPKKKHKHEPPSDPTAMDLSLADEQKKSEAEVFPKLPLELGDKIFTYFNKQELRKISLVSKFWLELSAEKINDIQQKRIKDALWVLSIMSEDIEVDGEAIAFWKCFNALVANAEEIDQDELEEDENRWNNFKLDEIKSIENQFLKFTDWKGKQLNELMWTVPPKIVKSFDTEKEIMDLLRAHQLTFPDQPLFNFFQGAGCFEDHIFETLIEKAQSSSDLLHAMRWFKCLNAVGYEYDMVRIQAIRAFLDQAKVDDIMSYKIKEQLIQVLPLPPSLSPQWW